MTPALLFCHAPFGKKPETARQYAAARGYAGIEWGLDGWRLMIARARRQRMLDSLQSAGLLCSVHAPYTDLEIKNLIDAGKVPGPKMHVTGPYLEGKGSFTPQMHAIPDPEDARRTVNFWADQGVTSFKAYNFITRDELKAAIDAAHARGLKVTGHLCSIGFREAAGLGIDDLEHGLVVDTEFSPEKKPDACPDPTKAVLHLATLEVSGPEIQQTIRTLVEKKVAVTSTLTVFETMVPGRPRAPDSRARPPPPCRT